MSESDRRQRIISSTPRLTSDEVANRSFAKGVRGFSETEVRAFLKRVAEDLAMSRTHEQELEGAIDSLEEQVRTPRPLSEQELLDALGEETARLLRSAREASDEIRKKAEERAARLVDEAAAAAERTRTEAADLRAARIAEAEARTAELVEAAEARAAGALEVAKAEAETILDKARVHGRDMLDEAKSARERVLGDLVRRRALLNAQIEALRGGRDRLLDAYRTVKRTFLDATEALAQVEARAAVERSASQAEPIDIAAEIAAEIEMLDSGGAPSTEEALSVDGTAPGLDAENAHLVPSASASEGDDGETEVATALADVDSLFARLRAGHDEMPGGVAASGEATDPTDATDTTDASEATQATDAVPAADSGTRLDRTKTATVAAVTAQPGAKPADEWRTFRARAVDPWMSALLKRAKRRAQDDQNALLDSVRRHKGRPTAQQVLGESESAVDGWSNVLREAFDGAYSAGRTATGAAGGAAGDDLVADAAESVIAPLRDRLTVAIDSGEEGDTGGLVERIGARYREWKNQTLERTLAEVLAAAWTRGVYDAVPDEAVLWWVPFEEGRCSDCDDNALEPTVKGKQFPTGQALPPAHPGCKCLLVPAGMLAGK
ncbi:MAG: DivIVA domain [Actinomycetia bacterium]|jgi:DivIVA domain-containing protein|nr:DivIVA domain [Actinomycetes bacterium]